MGTKERIISTERDVLRKHSRMESKQMIFLLLTLNVLLLLGCSGSTNTDNVPTSTEDKENSSSFIEGTYMQKEEICLLHFNKDGFVYLEYSGMDSDYWENGKKRNEGDKFYAKLLMSFKEGLVRGGTPPPNFYKYEKNGDIIYINLGDKGFLGLDCSNKEELTELARKSSKWVISHNEGNASAKTKQSEEGRKTRNADSLAAVEAAAQLQAEADAATNRLIK